MKRATDVTVSALLLLALLPLLTIIAILIRLTMGRPILFSQLRVGHKGSHFTTYKFRSMTEHRDEQGSLLPDEHRLTKLGRLLRYTTIDELPELINVLRGDMSLVGPRPLLVEYLSLYTPEQARRHEVKPGMSGWAQVNGRNALTWEERFELDVWYVDHWSLWLDAKILFLTPWKILKREGVSADGHATMPKFTGAKE